MGDTAGAKEEQGGGGDNNATAEVKDGEEASSKQQEEKSVIMCQCSYVLDPFTPKENARVPPPHLQHYCRICNIELNSCKQVRIHVTGKKHVKRCGHLKLSIETSNAMMSKEPLRPATMLPTFSAQCSISPQYMHPEMPAPAPAYSTCSPYFMPQSQAIQYQPPPAHSQYVPYGHYHPQVDYYPQAAVHHHHLAAAPQPPNPPPTAVMVQGASIVPRTATGQFLAANNAANMMSPSLTSGFSGSGGDCKSTETSSILSANSYASSSNPLLAPKAWNNLSSFSTADMSKVLHGGGGGGDRRAHPRYRPRFPLSEAHQFPYHEAHASSSTEDYHDEGESDAKDAVGVEASLRPPPAGANAIHCDVCHISVNSAQQFQAHVTGHRHRLHCLRLGFPGSCSSGSLLGPHPMQLRQHQWHKDTNRGSSTKKVATYPARSTEKAGEHIYVPKHSPKSGSSKHPEFLQSSPMLDMFLQGLEAPTTTSSNRKGAKANANGEKKSRGKKRT